MKNEQKDSKDDLSVYRLFKFTLLQIMFVLALLGVFVAACVHYFL